VWGVQRYTKRTKNTETLETQNTKRATPNTRRHTRKRVISDIPRINDEKKLNIRSPHCEHPALREDRVNQRRKCWYRQTLPPQKGRGKNR